MGESKGTWNYNRSNKLQGKKKKEKRKRQEELEGSSKVKDWKIIHSKEGDAATYLIKTWELSRDITKNGSNIWIKEEVESKTKNDACAKYPALGMQIRLLFISIVLQRIVPIYSQWSIEKTSGGSWLIWLAC